jgi:polyhydroxybutyrate depolymerase
VPHGGENREFTVRLPEGYDPDHPHPVVVSMHGRGGNAFFQEVVSRFTELADAHDFVVVYPQATGAQSTWNAEFIGDGSDADDRGFIGAMLNALEASLCVDPSRIYANGHSAGGFMAYRLACDDTARFAAVASVAGMTDDMSCSPSTPIPVFHFHGTEDEVVSYDGYVGGYMSVDTNLANWAERNGCDSNATVFFHEADTTCSVWSNCDDNAEVRLCSIEGGGHGWPGGGGSGPYGGSVTDTISASDMMWDFFSEHAR